MNIYRHQFICICPANAKPIIYNLELTALFMIRVEHIALGCQLFQQAFHEDIAAALHARFGGQIVLVAHHHGVDIETRLGVPDQRPNAVKFVAAGTK